MKNAALTKSNPSKRVRFIPVSKASYEFGSECVEHLVAAGYSHVWAGYGLLKSVYSSDSLLNHRVVYCPNSSMDSTDSSDAKDDVFKDSHEL